MFPFVGVYWLTQPKPITGTNYVMTTQYLSTTLFLYIYNFYLYRGFQAYLKGAPNYNFPLYRQLVHEITETFNKISAEIVTIKDGFSAHNNFIPVSEIINKIQTAEKSKLEMVRTSLQKKLKLHLNKIKQVSNLLFRPIR